MNIFILHTNAFNSAIYHCDKHCVKMILEICQMLYTAWWCSSDDFIWAPCYYKPYKLTHKNHPVAIWIREHKQHYFWALDLALYLCIEYHNRFHKIHKCYTHLLRLYEMGFPKNIQNSTHIIDKNKIATIHCPDNCNYFYCAIPDDIFPSCAVYYDGKLSARETYRRYYHTKQFDMKWNKIYNPPNWFNFY